ncbi:SET domain-containing protein [Amniculicola lignicola CBS 123094]|uniref:SET domain-containing protein n=1 Tax=Amniculicola lignicola CBS 123094 TaxID=1392246 RepID=A0A6A5W001_9PLEO|nr:SET domain-containing protein [Amniculicola lignicola CBS 123094]
MVLRLFLPAVFLALLNIAVFSSACDYAFPHQSDIPPWQSHNHTCTGSPTAYAVRPSLGKGLGVFAAHLLEDGAIIMQESPAMRIEPPPFRQELGFVISELGPVLRSSFSRLQDDAKATILSLTAHTTGTEEKKPGYDRLVTIFRSNAYNTGKDLALFPLVARINHSCRPNAGYSWSERLQKQIVFATRKIQLGEEISVSYVPLMYSKADRQKRLNQYSFKCTCEACSGSQKEIEISDERRQSIRGLFALLEKELTLEVARGVVAVKKALQLAHKSRELAKLIEEESLPDYYARAYRVAAISHARVEDWERATMWAHKSYQAHVISDPESRESQDTAALTSRFKEEWRESLRKKAARKS